MHLLTYLRAYTYLLTYVLLGLLKVTILTVANQTFVQDLL